MKRATSKNPIIYPKQKRSQCTFDSIVEAATYILEEEGIGSLTTNHIAQRAGISIASFYQYFFDKNAILMQISLEILEYDRHKIRQYREKAISQKKSLNWFYQCSIELYQYRPLLRKALLTRNMLLLGEPLISETLNEYEITLNELLPKSFYKRSPKKRSLALKLIINALIWNCNGLLQDDPFFANSKTTVTELIKMINSYSSTEMN